MTCPSSDPVHAKTDSMHARVADTSANTGMTMSALRLNISPKALEELKNPARGSPRRAVQHAQIRLEELICRVGDVVSQGLLAAPVPNVRANVVVRPGIAEPQGVRDLSLVGQGLQGVISLVAQLATLHTQNRALRAIGCLRGNSRARLGLELDEPSRWWTLAQTSLLAASAAAQNRPLAAGCASA